MTEDKIIEFHGAYHTAFIDKQCNSNLAYKPQLVYDVQESSIKSERAILIEYGVKW